MLFEGCPDDDMDFVCRGRVELIAVDGVLPDTSVKLGTKNKDLSPKHAHFYKEFALCATKIHQKMADPPNGPNNLYNV